MRVNTSWLLDYLEPACSHDELLRAFTAAGLEVEVCHRLSEALRSVVISIVRDKQPIPGAKGMYACRVDVSPQKSVNVVCASEHEIATGWGVPIALAGTTLPT